jgi:hypothetical protein
MVGVEAITPAPVLRTIPIEAKSERKDSPTTDQARGAGDVAGDNECGNFIVPAPPANSSSY